ncbi:MAG: hypothetical protein ACAH83_00830 [Alphaproteobacteria bacterium]
MGMLDGLKSKFGGGGQAACEATAESAFVKDSSPRSQIQQNLAAQAAARNGTTADEEFDKRKEQYKTTTCGPPKAPKM